MRITILRHGVTNLPEWNKIHSSRMPEWIEAYNTAGVKNESTPYVWSMVFRGFWFLGIPPNAESVKNFNLGFLWRQKINSTCRKSWFSFANRAWYY